MPSNNKDKDNDGDDDDSKPVASSSSSSSSSIPPPIASDVVTSKSPSKSSISDIYPTKASSAAKLKTPAAAPGDKDYQVEAHKNLFQLKAEQAEKERLKSQVIDLAHDSNVKAIELEKAQKRVRELEDQYDDGCFLHICIPGEKEERLKSQVIDLAHDDSNVKVIELEKAQKASARIGGSV